MAQTSGEIPQDKLDAYDRLIAAHPEIQRKGKSSPYTSLNGHMFTYLDKSGSMGIRSALFSTLRNSTSGRCCGTLHFAVEP